MRDAHRVGGRQTVRTVPPVTCICADPGVTACCPHSDGVAAASTVSQSSVVTIEVLMTLVRQ